MSVEKVKEYFKKYGIEDRVIELQESSATVELAAKALGTQPERIGKTLSFILGEKPILIVVAGDAKVDNKKFKEKFKAKAKMIPFDQVEEYIGHAPGGVCPFSIKEDTDVFLDISLKRFKTVFPAAGSGNSAIELTMEELDEYSNSIEWVDVCKGWQEEKVDNISDNM